MVRTIARKTATKLSRQISGAVDVLSGNSKERIRTREELDKLVDQEIPDEKLVPAGPSEPFEQLPGQTQMETTVVKNPQKPVSVAETPQPIVQPISKVTDDGTIETREVSPAELADIKAGLETKELDTTGVRPNLNKINSEDDLKKLIAVMFDKFKNDAGPGGGKILRKGQRGFKQVIEDANRLDSHTIMLMLLNRAPGDRPFTDAELLGARNMVASMESVTLDLLNKAADSGDVVDELNAAQSISLTGYALTQLVGVQEDYGRGLVMNKIMAGPSKARMDKMSQLMAGQDGAAFQVTGTDQGGAVITKANAEQFLNNYGGRDKLKLFLELYRQLPTDKRGTFAKRSLARKTGDSLVEIYQSSLISNPITFMYNLVGNSIMTTMLPVERFFEGRPREALSMVSAVARYMPQALRAGWSALKTEQASDATTKFDSNNVRAISADAWEMDSESAAGKFLNGFGIFMRMQGFRPMVATDEFFKALLRGMELESLATRSQYDTYRLAMKSGASKDDAATMANESWLSTIYSEESFTEANEFARMGTFQNDLPDLFKKITPIVNHPISKIWIPFYKTPSNIALRVYERSPFGIVSPTVNALRALHQKVTKGQADSETVAKMRAQMSKVMVGTGVGATIMSLASGQYGEDIIMTGYGPTDAKQRGQWLQRHKPYSFGVKKEDGSYEYISYERYDPLSGLLALAADSRDTLINNDNSEFADSIVLNLGLSTLRYIGSALPMMDFVGELIDLNGSPYISAEDRINRVRELVLKQATGAALVVGQHVATGGQYGQTMSAFTERYLSEGGEFASNTRAPNQYGYVPDLGFQPEIRGSYEALQKIRSRIPVFSKEVPRLHNDWFEPVKQLTGEKWDAGFPFKITRMPKKEIFNEEMERMGVAFARLSPTLSPQVKMNAEQFERFKELVNYPDRSEFLNQNTVYGYRPGSIPSRADALIYLIENKNEYGEEFVRYGNTASYQDLSDEKKWKLLTKLNGKYLSTAKKLIKLEFPELAALELQRESYGLRKPDFLKPPSDDAIEQIRMMQEDAGIRR